MNVGIIAEYDPFHSGHAYQIEEARRVSRAEAVIAVMSGSFVQRGAPACADKFIRAKWALKGGADLVIELPDALCCACAQRFAEGGIKLLAATGLIDCICFGSESGNIERLRRIASVELSRENTASALAKGISYPAALAESLKASCFDAELSLPNDILGVEYLRAINKFAPKIKAFAVKREGEAHNGGFSNGNPAENDYTAGHAAAMRNFISASSIRKLFEEYGDGAAERVKGYVPDFVYEDMRRLLHSGLFPTGLSKLSDSILYIFRTMNSKAVRALADVSEGLENVFKKASYEANNVSELLNKVKTKRYTLARLRRICINALLGTTEELQRLAVNTPDALYIRVLGVRREKIKLLSELEHSAALPVITKYSDISGLSANALRLIEHTRRASCVRSLANPVNKSVKDDFSHKLMIV